MASEIIILKSDIRDTLKEYLERDPTDAELKAFIEYLEIDVGDWIKTNVETFISDKLPLNEAGQDPTLNPEFLKKMEKTDPL
jgi:arsenate reductase-like glutaredoxin family protein